MKTTVVISDSIYPILLDEARRKYGSVRKMSALLNDILRHYICSKKRLFGTTKRFDISDVREEHDRFG